MIYIRPIHDPMVDVSELKDEELTKEDAKYYYQMWYSAEKDLEKCEIDIENLIRQSDSMVDINDG